LFNSKLNGRKLGFNTPLNYIVNIVLLRVSFAGSLISRDACYKI